MRRHQQNVNLIKVYKEKSVPKSRARPLRNKIDSNGLFPFNSEAEQSKFVLNNIMSKLPYLDPV